MKRFLVSLRLRRWFPYFFGVSSLIAIPALVYLALRSEHFTVKKIEISEGIPSAAPTNGKGFDLGGIQGLLGVETGKTRLIDLALDDLERRVLTHPWISRVSLRRVFPSTLQIHVSLREPLALFQSDRGSLSYVDREGAVFDELNLMLVGDLPVLSGVSHPETEEGQQRIRQMVDLLESWKSSDYATSGEIASIHWTPGRGTRLMLTYRNKKFGSRQRMMLDAGQFLDGRPSTAVGTNVANDVEIDARLEQVGKVLVYLSEKPLAGTRARFTDAKKVVVKVAPAS